MDPGGIHPFAERTAPPIVDKSVPEEGKTPQIHLLYKRLADHVQPQPTSPPASSEMASTL